MSQASYLAIVEEALVAADVADRGVGDDDAAEACGDIEGCIEW